MDNCCTARDDEGNLAKLKCPYCGSRGSAVDRLTAKAVLTELALRRLTPAPLHFCHEPACSVVYFTTGGQVYSTEDVRVLVWQKEPEGDRRICYCFDENEAAMAAELVETGQCDAIQRVRDHITAGRCACEVRNPRGTCCLGDLTTALARIQARVSLVEK